MEIPVLVANSKNEEMVRRLAEKNRLRLINGPWSDEAKDAVLTTARRVKDWLEVGVGPKNMGRDCLRWLESHGEHGGKCKNYPGGWTDFLRHWQEKYES